MKTSLPSNVERDITFQFLFQDQDDGYIELVFDKQQQYPYNGWNIIPYMLPSRVCILLCMILIPMYYRYLSII